MTERFDKITIEVTFTLRLVDDPIHDRRVKERYMALISCAAQTMTEPLREDSGATFFYIDEVNR